MNPDSLREETLKPCPFCGGEAAITHAVGEHWARCMTCEASTVLCTSRDRAIAAWNRRAVGDGGEDRDKVTRFDVKGVDHLPLDGPLSGAMKRGGANLIQTLEYPLEDVPTTYSGFDPFASHNPKQEGEGE